MWYYLTKLTKCNKKKKIKSLSLCKIWIDSANDWITLTGPILKSALLQWINSANDWITVGAKNLSGFDRLTVYSCKT